MRHIEKTFDKKIIKNELLNALTFKVFESRIERNL